jgi:hypothetical protein
LYFLARDGFMLASTTTGVAGTATVATIDDKMGVARVAYRFAIPNGEVFDGSSALPGVTADTLSLSRPLPVTYSPRNPSWSTVTPFRSFGYGLLFGYLFMGLLGLAVGTFFVFVVMGYAADLRERCGSPNSAQRPQPDEA